MAKKSAASLKVIKKDKALDVDPKGDFEKLLELETTTIDQQIICAARIDMAADIRKDWKEWFDEYPELDHIKAIQQDVCFLYSIIKERISGYKYEDFASKDWQPPLDDLLKVSSDCEDEEELWWAYMVYRIVRPYGEHAINIHQTIMDEVSTLESND